MTSRVRLAGGAVPLWSLIAPIILVPALFAALAASAVSSRRVRVLTHPPVSVPFGASNRVKPELLGGLHGLGAGGRSGTSSVPEILEQAEIRSRSSEAAAHKLARALNRDPGLVQEESTRAELRRLTESAQTGRIVLGTVAELPAPIAADILYEFWTETAQQNETTELARALLYSQEVRSKASPALAVALELREAQACEQAKALLPRAMEKGDRRSLMRLITLERRYGCGPNKRNDCYPCLRRGNDLEKVVAAVKERPAPSFLAHR